MPELIRLNKFLASRLGLSRRAADDAIASGKVSVAGQKAKLGERLDAESQPEVTFADQPVAWDYQPVYLAFHKPVGYVCSRKQQGKYPTIYSLLAPEYQNLKTVGRLDRDSSGLILLTNDGDFAQRMTHPSYAKIKVYEVTLDRPLEPLHQQMIADFGVELPDGVSRLGLTRLHDDRLCWCVEMSEGRNRQIRRTFAALGYKVIKLHRIQFGNYQLGDLKKGQIVPIKA